MTEIKQMFINGERTTAESNKTLQVYNPATGEVVGVVTFGNDSDAAKAIVRSLDQPEWASC